MVFIDCRGEGENMDMARCIWLHRFFFLYFFFSGTEFESLENLLIFTYIFTYIWY